MVSYTKSFRIKYPKPDYKFLEELVPYVDKHPDDTEAYSLAHMIINVDNPEIKKMFFWRVRKRVAEWRDRCYLDYVTSPESETYWAS